MIPLLLLCVGLCLGNIWTTQAVPKGFPLECRICVDAWAREHHFCSLRLVTPRPPLSLGFCTVSQATRLPPLFLSELPLHRHCFLIRSILSMTPLSSLIVHIAYVLVSVLSSPFEVSLNMKAKWHIQIGIFLPCPSLELNPPFLA